MLGRHIQPSEFGSTCNALPLQCPLNIVPLYGPIEGYKLVASDNSGKQ